MTAIKKKAIFKYIAIVTFVLAVVMGIIYSSVAKSDKIVKVLGGYVKSYEKVGDSYEGKVVFYKGDDVVLEKTYTYETEPKKGKTETVYYLTTDKDKYYDEVPNLYEKFMALGIVAGVFLAVSVVSFIIMKSIKVRRNAKVTKKIKVDENSIIRK